MIIDDSFNINDIKNEFKVEENKYGTIRVDGKTERELLREYRAKYGEEAYKELKESTDKKKAEKSKNLQK